ncbi:MAG: glycosyltransferase family 2 protein [Candidatus Goldbacteria bacterium]|nr:glycosyltransferase family 2 protein [Candidatus Goldiibacteriota bacterium]
MKRKNISAVIITNNEEKIIARCLDSLSWVDEIVVVDSGSTDNTVAISKRHNARVFYKKWQGYSLQKNFALSKAKGKWILAIDADELITDELRDEIKQTINTDNGEYDGYEAKRKNYYYGRFIRFGGLYPDYHVLLFRKGRGKFSRKEVHEGVALKGKKTKLNGATLHFTNDAIAEHVEKVNKYTELEAIQNVKNSKTPTGYSIFMKPFYNFIKNYFLKFGFLDGFHGLVFHVISSMYLFIQEIKTAEKMNLLGLNFTGSLFKRAKGMGR